MRAAKISVSQAFFETIKSSETRVIVKWIVFFSLPLVLLVKSFRWMGRSARYLHVKLGVTGYLILAWLVIFTPLTGYAVWYNQPAQKQARYIGQIDKTERQIVDKQREVAAVLSRYEQELLILRQKLEENQGEIISKSKQIENLQVLSQKLAAGAKEIASIRMEARDQSELSRIFDRKEIEKLQNSIEDILQNNNQNL